jgi:uncharacterized membrane protein
MADNDNVFVFIGTYASKDAAWEDYDSVKDLHSRGVIGAYDTAVVYKGADGKVHVRQREKPTEKGAWTGVAIGAVLGILFPPALIASAAIAAAVGGLAGHLWHGMSRSDMKDLGEALDAGTASLIVVGKSELAKKIAQATAHAQKRVEKELKINAKDFEKELAAEAKSI